VTDKINVRVIKAKDLDSAVLNNYSYICAEILAESLELIEEGDEDKLIPLDLTEEYKTSVIVEKVTRS
jgi:isoleucyl-tRNA synthetase